MTNMPAIEKYKTKECKRTNHPSNPPVCADRCTLSMKGARLSANICRLWKSLKAFQVSCRSNRSHCGPPTLEKDRVQFRYFILFFKSIFIFISWQVNFSGQKIEWVRSSWCSGKRVSLLPPSTSQAWAAWLDSGCRGIWSEQRFSCQPGRWISAVPREMIGKQQTSVLELLNFQSYLENRQGTKIGVFSLSLILKQTFKNVLLTKLKRH